MTQSTDELERLLKAGTPGPWEVSERIKDWRPQVVSTEHGPICTMHIPEVGDANPNAALICAAVNALPELLAKVKRLEEALSAIVEGAQLSEYEGLTDDRGLSMRLCGPNFLEDFTLGDLRHARAALKETGQ